MNQPTPGQLVMILERTGNAQVYGNVGSTLPLPLARFFDTGIGGEAEANARLFLAGNALLAVVKDLLARYGNLDELLDPEQADAARELITAARAAVATAKGEEP